MMNYFIIMVLAVLLVACGGGESSSTSQDPVITTQQPASTDTADVTTDDTAQPEPTMQDLIIPQQFDLSSKLSLLVDVDLYMGDTRAYLNVCIKGEDNKADYKQCLLRAPLSQSSLQTSIMLANSAVELVAEIWFYDTQSEPLRYHWQYSSAQSEAVFMIR